MSEYRDKIQELYDEMLAFATSLHNNVDDAYDNVQTVVLRFIEKEGKYEINDLKPLLMISIKNNFINEYRKKYNKTFIDISQMRGGTTYSADESSLINDIINEIADLQPELSVLIRMRVEGYKYDEIKRKTGVKMGTLKNRLFQAKMILKEKLDDKCKNNGSTGDGSSDEGS